MNKCTCFEDNLEKVSEHVKKQIPENPKDFEAEWVNSSFILAKGDYPTVNPKVAYSFTRMKKDGTPHKNKKKGDVFITANYCCFCGRKYKKSEKT